MAALHLNRHPKTMAWSRLFNRNAWDAGVIGGGKPLLSRAHERVEALTSGYREMEPLLDAHTCERLDYLVKCDSEELLKN